MVDNVLQVDAFRLKSRLYTLTVIELLNTNLENFQSTLLEMIGKAPKLFEKTPVVLDVSLVIEKHFSPEAHLHCLRAHGLLPIGIQGAIQDTSIFGMPKLTASTTKDRAFSQRKNTVEHTHTELHTQPVRSGQQVVSKSGDLVVLSAVSCGAEVLASGNIHIYGLLRGRALAGIAGNTDARIFCLGLQAELISIAGIYLMSDDMTYHHTPCQIYLKDEKIIIEPFVI